MDGPTSSDAFKALASDLRLRLFYAVGAAGEATATMLSREVGMSASLISYHLTRLGEFGLLEVVQAPGRDGRERWWRLRSGGISVDDDRTEGGHALRYAVLAHHADRLRQFVATDSPVLPQPDADTEPVIFSADMVIEFSADTASQFQVELVELLRKYARARGTGSGRSIVMVQGIPFVP